MTRPSDVGGVLYELERAVEREWIRKRPGRLSGRPAALAVSAVVERLRSDQDAARVLGIIRSGGDDDI